MNFKVDWTLNVKNESSVTPPQCPLFSLAGALRGVCRRCHVGFLLPPLQCRHHHGHITTPTNTEFTPSDTPQPPVNTYSTSPCQGPLTFSKLGCKGRLFRPCFLVLWAQVQEFASMNSLVRSNLLLLLFFSFLFFFKIREEN